MQQPLMALILQFETFFFGLWPDPPPYLWSEIPSPTPPCSPLAVTTKGWRAGNPRPWVGGGGLTKGRKKIPNW
jgi:hypothetical protein